MGTTAMVKPRLGFVGLGIMGEPMSGHLAAAGYELSVFDANADTTRRVAATHAGISAAGSPREVAQHSDIVITMLPDGRVVRRVALESDGLVEGFAPGAVLLDTSSAEPWITREIGAALASRQVDMVDAPVSGAQIGAQRAELVFMVGGSQPAVERVRPLLDIMGRAVFHLGPLASGHVMKCVNNLITSMVFSATMEGLTIGKRQGLDPAVMNAVLRTSTGGSWITDNHIAQRVLSRSFDDPFKLELMVKDIGIAMELARDEALPLPLCALGQQLWRAASLAAAPGASVSELARWVEQLTATELTPGPGPGSGER